MRLIDLVPRVVTEELDPEAVEAYDLDPYFVWEGVFAMWLGVGLCLTARATGTRKRPGA